MYGQEIKRTERPMHYRFLSMLLAFTIALSSVVVGITPLKAKAAELDAKIYQFKNGTFSEYTGEGASDARHYVYTQPNKSYSYFASYKVPQYSDLFLVPGVDNLSVHTYVDGNADNGTGVKYKNYFYSDTEINKLYSLRTPFDGSTEINTSVWHKQPLEFSTEIENGLHTATGVIKDGFADATEKINFVSKSGTEFFPDNIYVDWADAANWPIYNVKFAIKDYLAGKTYDYFANSSNTAVASSLRNDGAVWIDETVDSTAETAYKQLAAGNPKNIYIPTPNSAFKSNPSNKNGKNTSSEDIHPFMYMCTAELPVALLSGATVSAGWFKAIDQYGVKFSDANLTYSTTGNSHISIDSVTGKITVDDDLPNVPMQAIITVTAKTANSNYPTQKIDFTVKLGETVTYSNASRYTKWNSEMNSTEGDKDVDFYRTQYNSTSKVEGEDEYTYRFDAAKGLDVAIHNVEIVKSGSSGIVYNNMMTSFTDRSNANKYNVDPTKTLLSQIVTVGSGKTNYKDAYNQFVNMSSIKATLLATISVTGTTTNKTVRIFGDYVLKDSNGEAAGSNAISLYNFYTNQTLKEGWYVVYEDDDVYNYEAYHVFYLESNKDNKLQLYNEATKQMENIAMPKGGLLVLGSQSYVINQLSYEQALGGTEVKVSGFENNGYTPNPTSDVKTSEPLLNTGTPFFVAKEYVNSTTFSQIK